MLFPTTDFAVFFGLVFLISWLLNPFPVRWRLFMVAASYVFYAWWDWHFVFLLAGSTLLNYLGALGAGTHALAVTAGVVAPWGGQRVVAAVQRVVWGDAAASTGVLLAVKTAI